MAGEGDGGESDGWTAPFAEVPDEFINLSSFSPAATRTGTPKRATGTIAPRGYGAPPAPSPAVAPWTALAAKSADKEEVGDGGDIEPVKDSPDPSDQSFRARMIRRASRFVVDQPEMTAASAAGAAGADTSSEPADEPPESVFLKLHNEILDFCDFISATPLERDIRQGVVDELKRTVLSIWPKARVEVFGSQATGLATPRSDIDFVIFNAKDQHPTRLRRLAETLKSQNMVSFIEVIEKTKVPIVKFTHRVSDIQCDICFDVQNGLETADMTRGLVQALSPLKPLVLVLKYFLAQRGLNETYTGGIGSYLLLLMVISLLQHHQRRRCSFPAVAAPINLGSLMFEFFDLYGRKFNYSVAGISVLEGGAYFNKRKRGWAGGDRPGLLALENPTDEDIDIGKGAWQMGRIRRAFTHAGNIFVACVTPQPPNGILFLLFAASVLEAGVAFHGNDDGLGQRQHLRFGDGQTKGAQLEEGKPDGLLNQLIHVDKVRQECCVKFACLFKHDFQL